MPEIEFREVDGDPICPFCEEELKIIDYKRQKLSLGFMSGYTWVILLMCPYCHKVLGTQSCD